MLTEEEGIKAIKYLLAMSGDSEPEEISRRNWNLLTNDQKQQTELAYNMFKIREN